MKTILLAIAVLSVPIWAQSGIDRPRVGEMLDERGFLWPVFGIGGSFTLDDPHASRVLSTGCSRVLCVAKTESELLVDGAVTQAPAGPAEIAVRGATAWIYLPQSRQFALWKAGALDMVDLNVYGEVLSVQAGWKMAVRRGSVVWILSGESTILDSLPSDAGAVLLIGDGGVVYATSDSLVLRRPGGSEMRFPAPTVDALFQLGDGFVEARSEAAIYALRTVSGREQLYVLPQKNRIPPSPK